MRRYDTGSYSRWTYPNYYLSDESLIFSTAPTRVKLLQNDCTLWVFLTWISLDQLLTSTSLSHFMYVNNGTTFKLGTKHLIQKYNEIGTWAELPFLRI